MTDVDTAHAVLQSGLVPRGTRVEVFDTIFTVFLVLGTAVGVVVIGYMLYNGYKYRDGVEREEVKKADADRPTLGELPTGGGGGRKLFLSFALSTIVVVSLVLWTYATLLYVEGGAQAQPQDPIDVEVVGIQFAWRFTYENGHQELGTLRVPEDRAIRLNVTSDDVFHNFGAPALRVKTDAIPGQRTTTWFIGEDPGTYQAKCYELCGVGHSSMNADIVVMEPAEYEEWYASTGGETNDTANESASLVGARGVSPV
ncbi:cytochrome c oxidase subunit II [Salinirubellus salinus]|uniref:Cytochrome c oxidase subunit II n=1 Tax=Salinirubellus salinus TaxID=1364945 RepID=A0A9E7R3E3_9EURY|nr:cytochrome c oxidase subunit II [Salinirubellus salinus]UWM55070.1 cytochrome c oxidase subunit II [Salinirubellus salinus]